jgi:hypothetical protein
MAMPAFGDAYSDAEIAAVANYATARLGAGSRLTPENVARASADPLTALAARKQLVRTIQKACYSGGGGTRSARGFAPAGSEEGGKRYWSLFKLE